MAMVFESKPTHKCICAQLHSKQLTRQKLTSSAFPKDDASTPNEGNRSFVYVNIRDPRKDLVLVFSL